MSRAAQTVRIEDAHVTITDGTYEYTLEVPLVELTALYRDPDPYSMLYPYSRLDIEMSGTADKLTFRLLPVYDESDPEQRRSTANAD